MQLQQLLTVRPPNVGILSARNCADPCLRTTQMRGDLHLSATRSDDVSDDVLPVHDPIITPVMLSVKKQHHRDIDINHNCCMDTLGNRIKEQRTHLGLSQLALAKAVGKLANEKLGQSWVSMLEKGNRTETPHISELAIVLGVNAIWLRHGTGDKERFASYVNQDQLVAEKNEISEEDRRILSLFKRLPKAERTALLAMLEARLNAIQAERRLPKIHGEVDTEDLETTRDKKLGRLAMINKSAQ